jgi:hypothetical protein
MLTGLTGLHFYITDELGTAFGFRHNMHMLHCGFTDRSLIWLLSTQEAPCGIAVFFCQDDVSPSALQTFSAK